MTLNFINVKDSYNISLCFQENLYIKIIDTISFIEYELVVDDVSDLPGIPTVKSLYGILKGILENNTECIKFITHQNDLELDIIVVHEYYEFNFKLFLNKIKMTNVGDEKYTKKILQLEDKINNMQLALDNCIDIISNCCVVVGTCSCSNVGQTNVTCSIDTKILHIYKSGTQNLSGIENYISVNFINLTYFKYINYEEIYIGTYDNPVGCNTNDKTIDFSKLNNSKVKKIEIQGNFNTDIKGIEKCETLEELYINYFPSLHTCSIYLEKLKNLKKVKFSNCNALAQEKTVLIKLSQTNNFLLDIQ